MASLIRPDNAWALWAVMLGVAAFGLRAEKTRLGARLTGYIICIAVAILLSNTAVIPASAPAYDVVWTYLVPVAIPLLLFRADLRRILRQSGPLLVAFVIGAIGTVLGAVVAYHLVPLGDEGWKMTASFCATYIGGSLNYVACAEVMDLRSGDLLTAGVAADNLLTALVMLVLFALPSWKPLASRFAQREGIEDNDTVSAAAEAYWNQRPVTLVDFALSLAVAVGLCAISYGLAPWCERFTPIKSPAILIVTALVVAAATFWPNHIGRLHGGEVVGTYIMHVFFVAVGASANVPMVLRVGPVLFLFAGVILVVHLAVILLAGWALRLDIREVVIASNANVGGPPTAVALAVARRWDSLIIPSVLCGTLGYAVATFIGVAVAHWLH
ncbi:MAG TPA: DUF819 family protein [Candidatus Hydrogenedentes bacterium]|nr:DUF819 family protein [Candidatus Hydrogenedentota bacterium]HPG66381.1 DUF819 family protein [Candidatus Hydrogenedentota bacterium]